MGELGASDSSATGLEQLMVRYQNGDAAAAKALVDLLSAQLYSFFAGQMGDRTAAGDMTQEAWLRIHRVRHTFRPGQPLLPWVYAIARRVRIDSYRRRLRISRREVAISEVTSVQSPESPPANQPTFAELIAPLPESQREALTLLKVNGLTIEEVARATSSTTGAVKQKVHRAYERLRTLLQENSAIGGER